MRRCFIFMLLVASAVAAFAQNPPATVSIDTNASRHTINPEIYGVAFASTAQLLDLNVPLNRWGGNTTTRYNWQQNAANHANDWYYESISEDSGATIAGESDLFINTTRNGNAAPMITIPLIGWVAKLGPNRGKLASFSIAKYGAQQYNDWEWMPDAGNGRRWDAAANGWVDVTGNDKNDASVPTDSLFQQSWVQHMVDTFGNSAAGGVRYYLMDNEASIWFSSHRDVAPTGIRMEQYRDKLLDYAAKVKDVDANAQIVGPEEWGWLGVKLSGYDQQWAALNGQWSNTPDRVAHGDMHYMPWLLAEVKRDYQRNGRRLLDVVTTHYYPQSGEYSEDTSDAMKLLRNRSTRSLWDPAYLDESWQDDHIYLIPRLRAWSNQYLPGTKIGITEYNWGAEGDANNDGDMNGATAQADLFGIFGREGLDVATRWTTPYARSTVYKAIKMYRNYDGSKKTFGDISVSASGPDPDNVATFAALRSTDGALTVMVISKYLTGNTSVTLNFSSFANQGTADVWRLASNAISNVNSALAFSNSSLTTTVPAQSVTLFVIKAANVAPAPQILAIVPSSGPAAGGTSARVDGANFQATSSLKIGNVTPATGTRTLTSIPFTTPALAAGALYDVTVMNPNTLTATKAGGYFADFNDVPQADAYHSYVEKLFRAQVTQGCAVGNYCPDAVVTRAQMAIFLLRGRHGGTYAPLHATAATFSDVPVDSFGADFIEQLYYEGITSGCAADPLRFCPGDSTTRAAMAKFLLKAKHGGSYVPPPATGIFADVSTSDALAPYIEQLYAEGITLGCGADPLRYCPSSTVKRSQMAAFLVRAFSLP